MTFNPWLEQVYKTVSKDLEELPQWKRDALRRDEQFIASTREASKERGPINEDRVRSK
jgi:hypothetical protein